MSVTAITVTVIKLLLLLLLFCESSEGNTKLRVSQKMWGISLLAKKFFPSQKGL
jgi:hypothetical protein